jgi:hypothetical protein
MAKRAKRVRSSAAATGPLPVLTLIVDTNLTIQELNAAARAFLGPDHDRALLMRKGDAFHCAHSRETSGGCGSGRFCQICPIREAAALAWKEQRVVRRQTKAELGGGNGQREAHLLVTATPLPSRSSPRILLVLEDITALVELQKHVAICASCKRVHEDQNYWSLLDDQLRNHLDLELSHGVCPDCSEQLYGNLLGNQAIAFRTPSAASRTR